MTWKFDIVVFCSMYFQQEKIDNYITTKHLGKGAFGNVSKGYEEQLDFVAEIKKKSAERDAAKSAKNTKLWKQLKAGSILHFDLKF